MLALLQGTTALSIISSSLPPWHLQVWDLHVGATLRVMGRPITLLKADGETSAWIGRHSK